MIELRLNDKIATISNSSKISIEKLSPLFNESGSSSYPFTVPFSSNMHIFGQLNLPEYDGDFNSKVPFSLWFDGVNVFNGESTISSDMVKDEVELTLDDIRKSFNDKIEDLNCRDIEQLRKVKIGTFKERYYDYRDYYGPGKDSDYIERAYSGLNSKLPYDIEVEANVKDEYGKKDYCNARVICNQTTKVNEIESTGPVVGEYDRMASGVCFYVLYLMDCAFHQLGITITKNRLLDFQDFKRMAFFSTSFAYTYEYNRKDTIYGNIYDVFATSDNFPDADFSQLIDSMKSAFGMRIIEDGKQNSFSIVLMKDIMNDPDSIDLDCKIINVSRVISTKKKVKLCYNSEKGDLAFNVKYKGDITVVDGYDKIVKANSSRPRFNVSSRVTSDSEEEESEFAYNVRVDVNTGNAYTYILQVEENAKDKSTNSDSSRYYNTRSRVYTTRDLSLIEIGQFSPVIINDGSDDEEEFKIDFIPVIYSEANTNRVDQTDVKKIATAIYVDEEIKNISLSHSRIVGYRTEIRGGQTVQMNREVTDWSAINAYDNGFQIGIMRGPGSDDSFLVLPDYDEGFYGGDVYEDVNGNIGFESDMIGRTGALYDYLGSGIEEDVPEEERFSLKIDANKPLAQNTQYPNGVRSNKYPNRGLYQKFMSEYLHFIANHKTINFVVTMSIAQLENINWYKRYRIGEYVGWINKMSYELSNEGMSEVEIEMYMI